MGEEKLKVVTCGMQRYRSIFVSLPTLSNNFWQKIAVIHKKNKG
nr:MAG TPA: hypothetical protein [Caudoviricetes sp.]